MLASDGGGRGCRGRCDTASARRRMGHLASPRSVGRRANRRPLMAFGRRRLTYHSSMGGRALTHGQPRGSPQLDQGCRVPGRTGCASAYATLHVSDAERDKMRVSSVLVCSWQLHGRNWQEPVTVAQAPATASGRSRVLVTSHRCHIHPHFRELSHTRLSHSRRRLLCQNVPVVYFDAAVRVGEPSSSTATTTRRYRQTTGPRPSVHPPYISK